MAFLGGKSLLKLLTEGEIIVPFNPSFIKNGAYELSLGSEVFLTDSDPKKVQNLDLGEQVNLAPGQFALLLTEEIITVPPNKMAFISIKASVKYKGLINVSGFHVDAGFKGKLLFSVYNAGSSQIVLSRGSQYFPIWFAELDSDQSYSGKHEHQFRIPDGPIEGLSQGELTSPASLNDKIDKNQVSVMKEISLLERDQKSRTYLAGVALGLVITVLLKLGIDWTFATTAVNRELEIRQKLIEVDSANQELLMRKKSLLKEVDSLETRIRSQTVTSNDSSRIQGKS